MFALMRFLLPRSIVKISGGRETATDDAGETLLGGGPTV
jgi:biotin synthase-like enzyme